MTDNFGAITTVDLLHAMQFSQDQINKMKCNDPELIKKFCGDEPCLKWKSNQGLRMWPMPCKITTTKCNTSDDCKDTMGAPVCQDGFCSFCPKNAESGHCHVTTEETCLANSTLPYTCNEDTGCKWNDTKDKKKDYSYLEWRDVTCDDKNICPNAGQRCQNGKCTCSKSNDCPGNATCINGVCEGKRCVMGNFLLRQWCENPSSRCTSNSDGDYPKECKGDSVSPGVTDVPPFMYNKNEGKCYITRDYCNRFSQSYNQKKCSYDIDCDGGRVCYNDYCTGPGSECKNTTGQTIAKMVVGNTLFHVFQKGIKNCVDEHFTQPTKKAPEVKNMLLDLLRKFDKLPDSIMKVADSKLMKSKNRTGKDFAGPGIHLYLITWSDDSGVRPLVQSGFDAAEVKKVFPSLIKKKKGVKYIKMRKRDIGKDNRLKRIFLTLSSSQWVTSNIAEAYEISKK